MKEKHSISFLNYLLILYEKGTKKVLKKWEERKKFRSYSNNFFFFLTIFSFFVPFFFLNNQIITWFFFLSAHWLFFLCSFLQALVPPQMQTLSSESSTFLVHKWMSRQMHWTNVPVSNKAKYWVSWLGLDVYATWRRAMTTAFNSSLCAIPAEPNSRVPHRGYRILLFYRR